MTPHIHAGRLPGRRRVALLVSAFSVAGMAAAVSATTTAHGDSNVPDYGPNVFIFNPGMPLSQIQATVDAVAAQQLSNQFGTQRWVASLTHASDANETRAFPAPVG